MNTTELIQKQLAHKSIFGGVQLWPASKTVNQNIASHCCMTDLMCQIVIVPSQLVKLHVTSPLRSKPTVCATTLELSFLPEIAWLRPLLRSCYDCFYCFLCFSSAFGLLDNQGSINISLFVCTQKVCQFVCQCEHIFKQKLKICV